jgi:uncharacterized phage protein (TIGR02216 family)
MRFGLGVLRLSAESFWAMTPRELAAASAPLHRHGAATVMPRAQLDTLLAAFPDREAQLPAGSKP